MKILIVTDKLNFSCGTTKSIYNFVKYSKEYKNIDFHVLCAGGNAIELFEELKVQVDIIGVLDYSKRNLLFYIFNSFYAFFYITFKRIDIVHCNTHYTASIYCRVAKILKKNNFQTIHGMWEHKGRLNLYYADNLFFVNDYMKEFITEIKKKSASILRNGVQFNFFNDKKIGKNPSVLWIGRLEYEKGIRDFLAITDYDEFHHCKFTIAGDGNARKLVEEKIRQNKNLKYLGEVENTNKLFEETEVLIFTSNLKYEGFPMSVLEAVSKKCLIISKESIALTNYFNEKQFLYYRTERDLYTILLKLIKGEIDSSVRIEGSYRKATELFDIKKNSQLLISYYEKKVC